MVRLVNVHKRFGDNEVLKGIDLEVHKGNILVIIGPSGSGKSTLLRSINHLETIDEGEIWIEDRIKGDYKQGVCIVILLSNAINI